MSALTEKQQRERQGSRLRKRSTTMATSSHQQLGQRLTQRPRCSVFFYLRVPASAKDVLIKHWQKLAKMGYARVTTLQKIKICLLVGVLLLWSPSKQLVQTLQGHLLLLQGSKGIKMVGKPLWYYLYDESRN